MSDTTSLPSSARTSAFEPVKHYTGNRLSHVKWLIKLGLNNGTERFCCESSYGHTTKSNAVKCASKTIAVLGAEYDAMITAAKQLMAAEGLDWAEAFKEERLAYCLRAHA